MTTGETKTCGKCGKEKTAEQFYRNSYGKDGLNSVCKKCKLEASRKYYEANRDRVKSKNAKWHQENKARASELSSRRYQANKKAIRAKQGRREKERLASDPTFALTYRARRSARRGLSGKRAPGFFRHMPYSQDEFVRHLISTLPEGYTESDVCDGRKLHIDHIRPVCSFDLTGDVDDEFLKCWALENLRMIPAHENLKKSGKWGPP